MTSTDSLPVKQHRRQDTERSLHTKAQTCYGQKNGVVYCCVSTISSITFKAPLTFTLVNTVFEKDLNHCILE